MLSFFIFANLIHSWNGGITNFHVSSTLRSMLACDLLLRASCLCDPHPMVTFFCNLQSRNQHPTCVWSWQPGQINLYYRKLVSRITLPFLKRTRPRVIIEMNFEIRKNVRNIECIGYACLQINQLVSLDKSITGIIIELLQNMKKSILPLICLELLPKAFFCANITITWSLILNTSCLLCLFVAFL